MMKFPSDIVERVNVEKRFNESELEQTRNVLNVLTPQDLIRALGADAWNTHMAWVTDIARKYAFRDGMLKAAEICKHAGPEIIRDGHAVLIVAMASETLNNETEEPHGT